MADPVFSRYFYDLDLPDEVFEHKSIIEIERVATELIVMYYAPSRAYDELC